MEVSMIEGLRLTLTGEELYQLLRERASAHRRHAERWQREAARTADEQTEEAPLLPTHMCENEADRLERRARVCEFFSEHVERSETYRLSESDLDLVELLPPAPSWPEDEFTGDSLVRCATHD
jgi:hypothetical protein